MPRDSIEVIRMHGAKAAFGETRSATFGKAAAAAPFAIHTLGLGSGVATLAAEGAEHQVLAGMIAKWLLTGEDRWTFPGATLPSADGSDNDWVHSLLGAISSCSRSDYRMAQTEAMGYVGWIKKLAQALCSMEDG